MRFYLLRLETTRNLLSIGFVLQDNIYYLRYLASFIRKCLLTKFLLMKTLVAPKLTILELKIVDFVFIYFLFFIYFLILNLGLGLISYITVIQHNKISHISHIIICYIKEYRRF